MPQRCSHGNDFAWPVRDESICGYSDSVYVQVQVMNMKQSRMLNETIP